MKISIDRDELKAILCEHMARTFTGEWEVTTADYSLSREIELEHVTPAFFAAKAEAKRIQDEWERKDAEEQAAKAILQPAPITPEQQEPPL